MDRVQPSWFHLLRVLVLPRKMEGGSEDNPLDFVLKHNLDVATRILLEPKNKECHDMLIEVMKRNIGIGPSTITEICSLLKPECDDIRWKFVLITVSILLALNESLIKDVERYKLLVQDMRNARPSETSAPPLSPDTLSLQQKKTLLTCFQFVVCLAILPALQPGVGIPVARRSGYSSLLQVDLRLLLVAKYRVNV